MKRESIDGIAAGDKASFLAFYGRVSIPFLKYIYFRAGGDTALAEDV